jgi:hypothetical protein
MYRFTNVKYARTFRDKVSDPAGNGIGDPLLPLYNFAHTQLVSCVFSIFLLPLFMYGYEYYLTSAYTNPGRDEGQHHGWEAKLISAPG